MIEEIALPFYKDDVYGGFAVQRGLIHVDSNFLTIEFETKDAVFNVVTSGLKIIKIPMEGIQSVNYKKGFFSSKISITTKSLKYLANIPGNESNSVTFKIKKKDRELAHQSVSHIQLKIAENMLKNIEK